jgi:DNA-binding NtrC family response regulator
MMSTRPLRILIADDDRPYSMLLKKALTSRGHSAAACSSGEAAIARMQKESFDIILLDFEMEGTNGINVLQWMYGKKLDIPVIIITGHGSDEVYEEAFKWGAEEYFIKGDMDNVRMPAMVEQTFSKYEARKARVNKKNR